MLKKKYKLKPLFKHQLIVTSVVVFLVVVSFFSGSYAIFMRTKEAKEYNEIKVGDIALSYVDLSDEGNTLGLNNDYPVTDEVGSNGSSYRFSVENTGPMTVNYNIIVTDDDAVISSDGCSNNLLDKSNIKYKLDNGNIGILSDLYDDELNGYVIYTGTLTSGESDIHEIRLWIKEDANNAVLGSHFHGKVSAIIEQDGPKSLYALVKSQSLGDEKDLINYSEHSGMSGTNGVYMTTKTEGNVPVYFYRGKVDNNVIFAGFCWNIVRTTETGGVKLIYNGVPINENGKQVCKATGEARQVGKTVFNSSYDDNAYVGYMYGTTGASTYAETHANTNNSAMKTYLEGTNDTDGWFNTSGLKNYQEKLEDTVFCNDRSTVAGGNNNTLGSSYGTLGYGTNVTGYGSLSRSSYYTISPNPTYACPQVNDKFTVLKENGNGKLKYPVGLITSDEAVFAGFNTNKSNTSNDKDTNNYLYTGSFYWTFSPAFFDSSVHADINYIYSHGNLHFYFSGNSIGVRPVISLISGTLAEVGGDGTQENPYVVK